VTHAFRQTTGNKGGANILLTRVQAGVELFIDPQASLRQAIK
jgi:hypothetical protein